MNKENNLGFKDLFLASIGFSFGFSLMFFIISLPFLGLSQIDFIKNYIRIIGGIILIFFGLVLLDILKIPFLKKYFKFIDLKAKADNKNKKGILGILISSIIIGISFSSGWAPCVGPVMISVLSIIANQQKFLDGVILVSIMSLGLMTGFLLVSLLVYFIKGIISHLSKISVIMEKSLGVVFILMGIILITSKLNIFLSLGIGSDLLEKFSYNISSLSLFSILISFVAGFFIFLSPCTLPLVIPYVFYITGVSIKK
ncbi:MAG: cytochrome c biogenesis protein CcdA [bacterium]